MDLGLYRSLGSNLIWEGKKFLNKATLVKKIEYSASQILTTIANYTKLPAGKIYSADTKHNTTDIDTWKLIIDNDWINKKEYISEIFDCDNYAGSFSSHVADIYILNSAARVTVELRNPTTDAHIGYHRACLIVDDKLDCWLLETQTDKMIKIVPGVYPVIDNWKYIFNYVDIN